MINHAVNIMYHNGSQFLIDILDVIGPANLQWSPYQPQDNRAK